jgi:hypothetical protein
LLCCIDLESPAGWMYVGNGRGARSAAWVLNSREESRCEGVEEEKEKLIGGGWVGV